MAQGKSAKYDAAVQRAVHSCKVKRKMYESLGHLKSANGIRLEDTRFDGVLLQFITVKTHDRALYGEVLYKVLQIDPETTTDMIKGITTTRVDLPTIESIIWEEFEKRA